MSSKLSGTIERKQCPHRTTVELEDTQACPRVAKQLVGELVVEREGLQHHGLAAVRLDVGERVLQNGEVAQPEKVHLQQPELLAGRVVELRDDRAVLLTLHDRDVVDQPFTRHDHTGGMHAPLPLEVLQTASGVDHPLDVGIGLVERHGTHRPRCTACPSRRRPLRVRCPCPSPTVACTLVMRSPSAYG